MVSTSTEPHHKRFAFHRAANAIRTSELGAHHGTQKFFRRRTTDLSRRCVRMSCAVEAAAPASDSSISNPPWNISPRTRKRAPRELTKTRKNKNKHLKERMQLPTFQQEGGQRRIFSYYFVANYNRQLTPRSSRLAAALAIFWVATIRHTRHPRVLGLPLSCSGRDAINNAAIDVQS